MAKDAFDSSSRNERDYVNTNGWGGGIGKYEILFNKKLKLNNM